jgi:hypothetical protein
MDKPSFQEKELKILRSAVDTIDEIQGKKMIKSPEVEEIINIVEVFLRDRKRICYGGTAINNILPVNDQFYNKEIELPDYDFYSPDPLNDAKELADIYYNAGFEEVEAKSGMHSGTFKVFVNQLPVADITDLPKTLYNKIMQDSIKVDGIYYCSINYLRMSMYLELSRPHGDISRWEKVLKRLSLLNKHYPLRGENCSVDMIQRLFEYGLKKSIMKGGRNVTIRNEDIFLDRIEENIFLTTRESLIDQGCVFFGAFANRLYLKNINNLSKKNIPKIPDFDVLSEDPPGTARILKERLTDIGVKNITIKKHDGIGEVLAPHYEINVGPEAIVFIYEPLACHSYNIVNIAGKNIRIATLDTMLSFYLTFLYSDRKYYNNERIICMSEFLYRVQEKNRLEQRGILKRFSINCYGKQTTKEDIRTKKTKLFEKYKSNRNSPEWEWNFLKYSPKDNKSKKVEKKKKPKKIKTKTKTKKRKTKKAKKTKTKTKKRKTKKAKKKVKKKSNRYFNF